MSLTVRDVMATSLVTVRPRETARHAYRLMRDHRFRHLPVVEDGRLVGVLSDRDLRPVLLSPTLARAQVGELDERGPDHGRPPTRRSRRRRACSWSRRSGACRSSPTARSWAS